MNVFQRILLSTLFLFTTNALAVTGARPFKCGVTRDHARNVLVLGCSYRSYPEFNNHFIGRDSRGHGTRFSVTGQFRGTEAITRENPQCSEDPYSGQRDCGGQPDYIEFDFKRTGYFQSGFDEFEKLLREMREGSFGSGQVLVHCDDPNAKSDCEYEILNYRHMYWCEGSGCP